MTRWLILAPLRLLWWLIRFLRFPFMVIGYALLLAYGVEYLLPEDRSDLLERWTALNRAGGTFSEGAKLTDWDAAVHLAPAGFQEFADRYDGLKLVGQNGIAEWLGLSAALRQPSLAPERGRIAGHFRIELATGWPWVGTAIGGDVSARSTDIVCRADDPATTDAREDESCALGFDLAFEKVRPEWGAWRLLSGWYPKLVDRAERQLGRLATDLVFRSRDKQALAPAKLPFRVALDVDVDDEDEMSFKVTTLGKKDEDEKKVIGSVTLRQSMPKSEIARFLHYQDPIISDRGVMLLARAGGPERPAAAAYRAAATPADIAAAVETLEADMATTEANFADVTTGGDYALWLNSSALLGIANDIAALPPDKRTITVTTVATSGRVASLGGNDKNLGEFGAWAELKDNSLGGSILVDGLKATSGADGIAIAGAAHASAGAVFRITIKPPVMPPASYDPAISAAAEAGVSGQLRLITIPTDGHTAAYWGFDFACTSFDLFAETAGGKVFGILPVTFDALKVRIPETLFDKKGKAGLLFDGLPERRPVTKPATTEEAKAKEAEAAFRLVPPSAGLDMAVVPTATRADSAGYLLAGDLVLTPAADFAFTPEEIAARDALREKMRQVRFPGTVECSPAKPFLMTLDGLSWGTAEAIIEYIALETKGKEAELKAATELLKGNVPGASDALKDAFKAKEQQFKAVTTGVVDTFTETIKNPVKTLTKPLDAIRSPL